MSFPSKSPFFRLGIVLAFLLPALAGGVFAFNVLISPEPQANCLHSVDKAATATPETLLPETYDKDRDVYKVVDQMPLFPGYDCGEVKRYRKRKVCADKAMLEYIYSHVRYPEKAREEGITGMAVVCFIVEKTGVVSNIEVVRDPGGGLGEAAAKVVRQMKADNLRWEVGLHKGKPVRVQFNLPVKFELE